MRNKKIVNRKTIRKGIKPTTQNVQMFLYGKLKLKYHAKAYCKLHRCYLDSKDIIEKKCNRKKCKYKIEI